MLDTLRRRLDTATDLFSATRPINMKFLRRKKNRTERIPPAAPSADTEETFYTQQPGPAPLDEYSEGQGGRQVRRTSRHTPARRRENSNRAGHREMTFLMLRIILIPALIVAAFFGLRIGLSFLNGPSQKDIERWEANSEIMEKGVGVSPATVDAEEILIDKAVLESRMMLWMQADRHLRAAEALDRRGIDDEAVTRLKQALRSAPDSWEIQKLLLDIYLRFENYVDAIPLCVRLLDQDVRNWDVKMSLLKALQETGQMDVGLLLSDQMLVVQPENMRLLEFSAYANAAQNNTELALEIYDRILQRDEEHLLALEGSAYIYQWRGEWQKAIPYYMELVRKDPQPERYHALAKCYAHQNEGGKAVIFLGQAASLYGESEVSSWLSGADFDLVREVVDFRAFTDRIVGVETRKAIEAISRRKVEQDLSKEAAAAEGFEFSAKPDLQLLKPGL